MLPGVSKIHTNEIAPPGLRAASSMRQS